MSTTSTPKRVSFGGDQGSLVETLIIDDNPPSVLKNGHMMTSEINGNAQQMETPPASPAKSLNSTSSAPSSPARVEVRQEYMESHENPFTEEGELHKKAEHILRHSTISRTEVKIEDPDTSLPEQVELIEVKTSSPTHAAPPSSDANGVNEQTVLKENGKTDQVDGKAAKPKDKQKGKCKCCTIQ